MADSRTILRRFFLEVDEDFQRSGKALPMSALKDLFGSQLDQLGLGFTYWIATDSFILVDKELLALEEQAFQDCGGPAGIDKASPEVKGRLKAAWTTMMEARKREVAISYR